MTDRADPLPIYAFIDPDRYAKDMEVDINNLDEKIIQYGSMLAYYSTQAARARRQLSFIKARCSALEGVLKKQVRESLIAVNGKTTDAVVDSELKCHPKWLAIQEKIAEAELQHHLADGAFQSLRSQKDSLVQLSTNRRAERVGELRIQEQSAGRENMMKAIAAGRT